MTKHVAPHRRRSEIAEAVARLAATEGLQGITFREVAAEAGVSASLIQHHFGTKENLLVQTLDIRSAAMGERILARLGDLGPEAGPLERVRTVAVAFIPDDDESRSAMLLYHGFAAAALTDHALRSSEAFRNEANLRGYISEQLALADREGQLGDGLDPDGEARAILSMILGLSLTVLLEGSSPSEAEAVLDAHLAKLARRPGAGGA